MKEVLVTKLDKEDLKKVKELEKGRQEIEGKIACFRSTEDSFWLELKGKYQLTYGYTYYIEGKAIYTAES